MNSLTLILALSWNNLKSLQNRIGPSLVIVVGIAGVVAVLVSLLAMAKGFQGTFQETGRSDRALILRAGSTSELNGNMLLEHYQIVALKAGIAQHDGQPLASRETFIPIKLPAISSDELTSTVLRGANEFSMLVRPEMEIIEGRTNDPNKFELLVGVGAARQIESLEVGNTINIKGTPWLVAGHFAADGSAYESEIWAGERLVAEFGRRGGTFSSMLVQLESEAAFDGFADDVRNDKRLTAWAQKESEYYAAQSESTTQLINAVGILIGVIMSIGAIFAALNTMYAAVSTRTVEIATLRALGFRRLPIFITVISESMILALLGGAVGGGLSYLALNGYRASSAGGAFNQVSFQFQVTPELLTTGLIISLLLGLIGGSIPAISAVRMSIIDGLKKL